MNAPALRAAAAALLLAATWLLSRASDTRAPGKLFQPLESLPRTVRDWTAADERQLDARVLTVLKPAAYLDRSYRRGENLLDLFAAYYARQRPGESIHSPKNCLPGGGWEVSEAGYAGVTVDGKRLTVNQYRVRKDGSRVVVLYWYQSRARVVANEYAGKFFLFWDAVTNGDNGDLLVRVALPERPGAVADGLAFSSALIPAVFRCLGGRGAAGPPG